MIKVSADEFQLRFARYEDEALVQPIAITRDGLEHLVVLSSEAYHRLKRGAREVLLAGELSDADLARIAATEMDARHAHLDGELE